MELDKVEKTSEDRRNAHLERRKEQGLSYREMEKDFGISKSKIHRDMNKDSDCE